MVEVVEYKNGETIVNMEVRLESPLEKAMTDYAIHKIKTKSLSLTPQRKI